MKESSYAFSRASRALLPGKPVINARPVTATAMADATASEIRESEERELIKQQQETLIRAKNQQQSLLPGQHSGTISHEDLAELELMMAQKMGYMRPVIPALQNQFTPQHQQNPTGKPVTTSTNQFSTLRKTSNSSSNNSTKQDGTEVQQQKQLEEVQAVKRTHQQNRFQPPPTWPKPVKNENLVDRFTAMRMQETSLRDRMLWSKGNINNNSPTMYRLIPHNQLKQQPNQENSFSSGSFTEEDEYVEDDSRPPVYRGSRQGMLQGNQFGTLQSSRDRDISEHEVQPAVSLKPVYGLGQVYENYRLRYA